MPAPDFTKAQIDALVAKMNHEHTDGRVDDWTRLGVGPGSNVVHRHNLTTALYLAAGLTSEGERKPERVRCWMYDDRSITSDMPNPAWGLGPTTPGWFVPDGAE